jgi:negative regulator of replication initiation
MHSIEIDFEVYKALTIRRETEAITYNDVIRDLLSLSAAKTTATAKSTQSATLDQDWICKGVRFAEGTEFRAHYKGAVYYAKVESGSLVVNGQAVTSPSDAAKVITKTSVNGWTFWECRVPGQNRWKLIKGLRSTR